MNTTISTTRPLVSTTMISVNQEVNSHTLDELLAASNESRLHWMSSGMKLSSRWFSKSSYLGFDDDNYLMYGLTRSESFLFSAGTIAGITIIGSLIKWLFL